MIDSKAEEIPSVSRLLMNIQANGWTQNIRSSGFQHDDKSCGFQAREEVYYLVVATANHARHHNRGFMKFPDKCLGILAAYAEDPSSASQIIETSRNRCACLAVSVATYTRKPPRPVRQSTVVCWFYVTRILGFG